MNNWYNKAYLAIAVLGIFLSAYLWWFQVSDMIVPCTNNGCEEVLTSEYGKMLGVPMAIFGFFYYVTLIYVPFLRLFIKHKLLDWSLFLQIIWGIIFSIYLRYLEFFVIHHICIWCWGSVGLILVLAVVFVIEWRKEKLDLFNFKF